MAWRALNLHIASLFFVFRFVVYARLEAMFVSPRVWISLPHIKYEAPLSSKDSVVTRCFLSDWLFSLGTWAADSSVW